jgi:hypothetical protein
LAVGGRLNGTSSSHLLLLLLWGQMAHPGCRWQHGAGRRCVLLLADCQRKGSEPALLVLQLPQWCMLWQVGCARKGLLLAWACRKSRRRAVA